MENPYNPNTPANPDYFGGRKEILQRVKSIFEEASNLRRSSGILIYGYRGVGKSSLIEKIIDMAGGYANHESGNLIIKRRLSRTTNDQELYAILNEELLEKVRERKGLAEKIIHKVNTAKVKVFDIEVSVNEKDEVKRSPFQQWKFYMRSLKNVELVIVALDDADYLSSEALSELKTILEERTKVPIVLVVSGGIRFEERLVDDYSPVARGFSGASFNLGKFELRETKEVLEKPLKATEAKWDNEAVTELHKLAAGYPYLVQCLAYASYGGSGTLSTQHVKKSIPEAIRIGKSWLDHEITEASDQDIISFTKLIKLERDVIKSSEISALGVASPYIGRLVKLQVLKQISRGRYTLQKSPIIARYQMLKRKLDFTE
ncbi:ATP-binding protein [Candidatus Woesearchaeota archaeon]|nr:ATP-binding protein [Candidatus Woesearchaeota archaeon]